MGASFFVVEAPSTFSGRPEGEPVFDPPLLRMVVKSISHHRKKETWCLMTSLYIPTNVLVSGLIHSIGIAFFEVPPFAVFLCFFRGTPFRSFLFSIGENGRTPRRVTGGFVSTRRGSWSWPGVSSRCRRRLFRFFPFFFFWVGAGLFSVTFFGLGGISQGLGLGPGFSRSLSFSSLFLSGYPPPSQRSIQRLQSPLCLSGEVSGPSGSMARLSLPL